MNFGLNMVWDGVIVVAEEDFGISLSKARLGHHQDVRPYTDALSASVSSPIKREYDTYFMAFKTFLFFRLKWYKLFSVWLFRKYKL